MCLKNWMKNHKEKHGARTDVSPCPECGSERTYTTGQFRPLGLLVVCKNCGLRGPLAQTREEAIALWEDLVSQKKNSE